MYPPPYRLVRRGLILGAGIGFGSLGGSNCDCGGGLAAEFHLGAMITPRFGLMYDVSTVIHSIDSTSNNAGLDVTNTIHTIAGQLWLTERFWVKGGFGVGHLSYSDDFGSYSDETAAAVMGGIGFEVVQSSWFALDLQGRLAYAGYDAGSVSNGMFLIGFNWY